MKYLQYLFIAYIVVLSTGCGGSWRAVSAYEMDYLEKNGVKPKHLVDAHQARIRTNGDSGRGEGAPIKFFLLPDTSNQSKVTVPVIKLNSEENQEGWTLEDKTRCVISAASLRTATVEVKCSGEDCGLRMEENYLPELQGDDTLKTFRLVTTSLPNGSYVELDGEQVEVVGISFDGKTYICTNEDWRRVCSEIKVKEDKKKKENFKKIKNNRVKRRVN